MYCAYRFEGPLQSEPSISKASNICIFSGPTPVTHTMNTNLSFWSTKVTHHCQMKKSRLDASFCPKNKHYIVLSTMIAACSGAAKINTAECFSKKPAALTTEIVAGSHQRPQMSDLLMSRSLICRRLDHLFNRLLWYFQFFVARWEETINPIIISHLDRLHWTS